MVRDVDMEKMMRVTRIRAFLILRILHFIVCAGIFHSQIIRSQRDALLIELKFLGLQLYEIPVLVYSHPSQ